MPISAIQVNPILPVWLILALAFAAFVIPIIVSRMLWGDARYEAKRAWCLAGIYFMVCLALSIVLGVFPALVAIPVAAEQLADMRWWAGLLVVLAIVIVAYGIVWPIGTQTHGRPQNLPVTLGFGILWGVSEGQLFLCIWAIFQLLLPIGWLVPFASFVAIASFSGLWHSQFWDRYIAPEHNDPAWNIRKILFAHVPSLAATLSFLALTGNALIFVLLQTVALSLSSVAMRMPRWASKSPR